MKGQQRTDATHVAAAVRQLNRLEILGETVQRALNELAESDPAWMQSLAKLEWFSRYGRRFEQICLPKEKKEREALAEPIGLDGIYLLEAIGSSAQAEEPWEVVVNRNSILRTGMLPRHNEVCNSFMGARE